MKQRLNEAVLVGLKRYLRCYAYVALAPLHLKIQLPGEGAPTPIDAALLATLDDPLLTAWSQRFPPRQPAEVLRRQGGNPY